MLYSDELYHHGIKGQKWGVRRYQNKDGSLTAAGRQHRNELHSGTRKESAAATIVALLPLIIGVGSMVGMGVAAHRENVKAEKDRQARLQAYRDAHKKLEERVAQFDKERAESPIDKKTGYHKKTKEMTVDEDLERVNPEYLLSAAFSDTTHGGCTSNCALCSMTYDMRRRGYEVTAGTSAYGMSTKEIAGMYKTKSGKAASMKTIQTQATDKKAITDSVESELTKNAANSRGIITVDWKMGSGHAMAYEVNDGKLTILDGQTNKKYSTREEKEYLFEYVTTRDLCFMRTDTLEPDTKKMKGYVV